MLRKLLLTLFLAVTLVAASRWDEEGRAWWRNVEYLASDDMQGRYVGTPGFDLAANYVAAQFERTGLKAAGNEGYFQKVLFAETALNMASVSLERDGRKFPVLVPTEAHINFSRYSASAVEAPVVFAGYGLQIPEIGQDDFSGLHLRGAIVAYLASAPDDIPVNLRAHYNSSEVRWQAMKAAGAIGMIAIQNPKTVDLSWGVQSTVRGSTRLALADPKLNPFSGLVFSATWNPMLADQLLAGSGHKFSEILAAADNNLPLPHFSIGCKLKARLSVVARLVTSKNVVAVHPGSDPNLKDEYVIVSAHLDHLGMGRPDRRDTIFSGAMDDATGVSSVIEIAKKLRHVETKRSIIFLSLTGEEKGELGSEYFTKYPTVKGKIVADLNMDMFLPLFPLKWLEVQGLNESTLGNDITAVAETAGVQVQQDKEPNKNRFIRSDQYSFVKMGIPALAFKFGYQKGEPEEKVFQNWFTSRYHSVNDNVEQPVDLEAAAKFNDLLKTLLVRVADADKAPHWHGDSFFKRFADTPGM